MRVLKCIFFSARGGGGSGVAPERPPCPPPFPSLNSFVLLHFAFSILNPLEREAAKTTTLFLFSWHVLSVEYAQVTDWEEPERMPSAGQNSGINNYQLRGRRSLPIDSAVSGVDHLHTLLPSDAPGWWYCLSNGDATMLPAGVTHSPELDQDHSAIMA